MPKKKVMIDCDPGVDDALALIFAFHSPELDIRAVTGVSGNVPLDLVFENIKKVLSLIQSSSRPWIAKGSERPLRGNPVYAYSVHGRSGLGDAKITEKEGEKMWHLFSGSAAELILKMAHDFPWEITLIATGPLTNLAIALERDPKGMRKLREIIVMGGAIRTEGNITPHAEFNVFVDPLAAKRVFESGLPMTLVPLDVTSKVSLSPQVIEDAILPKNNLYSRFLIEATGYDPTTRRFRRGVEVFHLHDPLAVGAAIDPTLMRKEKLSIRIETREGEHYGETREISGPVTGPGGVDVCLEVDAAKFLGLFLSRLAIGS